MKITRHMPNRRSTPQTEPIPGREKEMVQNSAGGFTFQIDPWDHLNRFLILGSEGGTYYASEKKLTRENAKMVESLIGLDGLRVVRTVVEISDAGRAPKNDPALFVLAMCCKLGDDTTKAAAYAALPKVARIGTHLFHWAEAIKAFGGFTSGFQKAVSRWYLDRDPGHLALQAVKYQSRDGWSHADMLRLAKPGGGPGRKGATPDSVQAHILGWITGKWAPGEAPLGDATDLIWAFEQAKALGLGSPDKASVARMINLITDYRMPREAIPTNFLNEVAIWEALLDKMPMEAMIRNLPKMTSIGLLGGMGKAVSHVVTALEDQDALVRARVHPLKVLVALRTYSSGRGIKGSLTWTPHRKIVNALDGAFYKTFKAVEPTGKRYMLALDISGSMGWESIAGMPITPREASAAMSMVTDAVEPSTHVVGFSHTLIDLDISARRRLDDNIRSISNIPFGATDCALPMKYALQRKEPVDVFVVYTDSETFAGVPHPSQALKEYRDKMGIPARMAVVGMTATGFTIADPKDSGMIDVTGMDLTVPAVLSEFAKGNL